MPDRILVVDDEVEIADLIEVYRALKWGLYRRMVCVAGGAFLLIFAAYRIFWRGRGGVQLSQQRNMNLRRPG